MPHNRYQSGWFLLLLTVLSIWLGGLSVEARARSCVKRSHANPTYPVGTLVPEGSIAAPTSAPEADSESSGIKPQRMTTLRPITRFDTNKTVSGGIKPHRMTTLRPITRFDTSKTISDAKHQPTNQAKSRTGKSDGHGQIDTSKSTEAEAPAPTHANTNPGRLDRQSDDFLLGIKPSSLRINGIHLGFLPDFAGTDGQHITASYIAKALAPASPAVIGDYIHMNKNGKAESVVAGHLNDLKQSDSGVYVAAWQPEGGCSSMTPSAIKDMLKQLSLATDRGLTVWLRYAYEMNGDWDNGYGGDPEGFKSSWLAIHKAIQDSGNDKIKMFFSPNVYNGKPNPKPTDSDWKLTYDAYWPGEDYVDIVGLSLYMFTQRGINGMTPSNGFSYLAQGFHDRFAAKYKKPMAIGETASAFYYQDPQFTKPSKGQFSNAQRKIAWMQDLFAADNLKNMPWLQSVHWFNIKKEEDFESQYADFRLISKGDGYPEITKWIKSHMDS